WPAGARPRARRSCGRARRPRSGSGAAAPAARAAAAARARPRRRRPTPRAGPATGTPSPGPSLTRLLLDPQKIGAIGRRLLGQPRILLGQLLRPLDRPRHVRVAALGGGMGQERPEAGQRRAVLG